MAVGWSPAGLYSVAMRIGTPPSDLSGRAGRCGVQVLPFLNSGLPLSISADSACTVAVLALVAPEASASSIDMSRPATALRPAAARSRGLVLAPIEVPRAVFLAFSFSASAFSASAGDFPAFLRCLPAAERISRFSALRRALTASSSASFARSAAQSAIEPAEDTGAPESFGCGASSNPSNSEPSGRVFFAGDLAMAAIWAESAAKERGPRSKRRTKTGHTDSRCQHGARCPGWFRISRHDPATAAGQEPPAIYGSRLLSPM
jgi:hypothetical protein